MLLGYSTISILRLADRPSSVSFEAMVFGQLEGGSIIRYVSSSRRSGEIHGIHKLVELTLVENLIRQLEAGGCVLARQGPKARLVS